MSGVMKIEYGSELHRRILDAIRRRWRLSYEKMNSRYSSWSDMEDQFQAFIPTKENDKLRQQNKKSSGVVDYVTIELPYGYAQLLSAHTYWTSVFLSRTPIFQYQGRHGEAEHNTQAVEAIIDYQASVGQMLVPLYIWLLDAGKYGVGVLGNYWTKEEQTVSEIIERPKLFMGIEFPGRTEKVKQTRRITGYEGNSVYNVRPFDWFPDPRVTVANFQKGEFCGSYAEVGWNTILKREADGTYFNVKIAKKSRMKAFFRDRGSSRLEIPDIDNDFIVHSTHDDDKFPDRTEYVGLMEMCIELVPEEWKLGTSKYPEKWMFTVVNDDVIVSAQPLGMNHNKFPFHVLEYEIEGYSIFKRSMLEQIKPLTDVMTWLFNSHFYNVRAALNGNLVVDPSRLVMGDLLANGPGRMIRMKPAAYGTDPRLSVHQLDFQDVTQNHLRDVSIVAEMVQRMTGVTDNIMGLVNSGGRKTATEVRTSSANGVNRLKTNSEYFSSMGFYTLAQMLLQNTQQLYDGAKQFRIAGDLMQSDNAFISVSPDDIAGFYDFMPVDGTLPIDRMAQASLWRDLLGEMQKTPMIAQRYDVAAIFGYVAQLASLKNIKRFEIQLSPQEQLMQAAQAGNVVPLQGGAGVGARGPGKAGTPSEISRPTQISGMGPAL